MEILATLKGKVFFSREWPGPRLISEIIGRSELIVASSLHACITALSYGAPVAPPRPLAQGSGAVVPKLRLEKKWSQVDVAIKAGYTSGWVSKMERGKTNPKLEFVVALADTFDLKLSQFFARVEPAQRKK